MKTMIIAATVTLAFGSFSFAGEATCPMPPASKCPMMPDSSQNSRENLVYVAANCCKPGNNIKADISTQNSRQAVLTSGSVSPKTGTTFTVYSEKGARFIQKEVEKR